MNNRMTSLFEYNFEDFFVTGQQQQQQQQDNHHYTNGYIPPDVNNTMTMADSFVTHNINAAELSTEHNNYNYYSSPEMAYHSPSSLASPLSAPGNFSTSSPHDIISPSPLDEFINPPQSIQPQPQIKIEEPDQVQSQIELPTSVTDITEQVINREVKKQKQSVSNVSTPIPVNTPSSTTSSSTYSNSSSNSTALSSSMPTPPAVGLDYNGRKPRKWRNRKYKCSHCGISFLDQDLHLYAQHIEEIEKEKGGIAVSKRKYKCAHPSCPWHKIGFVRKLEAQKHYVRKHGVPQFECRFWSENGEKYPGCGVCTTRWHADSGNRSRHEHAIHGNGLQLLKDMGVDL
ncbi:hypothetical protein TRICI_002119 [Trichomonascus ciferrii]|uniref:Uncharacterized protein n=1 Tax=Trichomonascus ciferrii TaxID=44093 RepID=A0A642V7I4_9ASCO|nr:hypothetical protein TRICI_002119 [Trichomonascus ciferrii]